MDTKKYIALMVAFFVGGIALIGGLFGFFIGSTVLTYGQAIVDNNVWTDELKYPCQTYTGDKCTVYNKSGTTEAYQQHLDVVDELNDTSIDFIQAFSIIIALFGLVVLVGAFGYLIFSGRGRKSSRLM